MTVPCGPGSILYMETDMTDAELIEIGRRTVLEKGIRDAGARITTLQADLDTAKVDAKVALLGYRAHGGEMTEAALAQILGVDRMTLRNWLGKGRKAAEG